MKNWKDIIVHPNQDFETLIRKLHDGGMQFAIVVNEKMEILGTVTDGDIRRALLKKFSMNISIKSVMNSKPITAKSSWSESDLIGVMKEKNLFHLPIVDNKNKVIGLKLLHDLINDKKIDNPVVIMAGGFGKRMMPLTKNLPKPMLKIKDKPLLESIITKFKENGFINFFISLHYKGEIIKKYFGDGAKWDVKINYLDEKMPLGTAGSLSLLKDYNINKPIIVMNGDILSNINFRELIQFHNNKGNAITVCVKEHAIEVPFGVVKIKNECVEKIDEKPSKVFHVNAGIYVINPKLIRRLKEDSTWI